MYEQYYGLSSRPFQLRPDPNFFFSSKNHQKTAAYLDYCLSQYEGFVVVTGEAGTGKTLQLRKFAHELPAENFLTGLIYTPLPDSDDILHSVSNAFNLSAENAGKAELLGRLERFWQQCSPRRPILLIDEAQNLSPSALEELRMLSNCPGNAPQIFLFAQPGLGKMLLSNPSLCLRIIAACELLPLDAIDTRAYIEHRLQTAGWQDDPALDDAAHAAIYQGTSGIPQKINRVCERLLLMGYLEEIHSFDAADIDRVIRDIQQELRMPPEEGSKQPDGICDRLARIEQSMHAALNMLAQYRNGKS